MSGLIECSEWADGAVSRLIECSEWHLLLCSGARPEAEFPDRSMEELAKSIGSLPGAHVHDGCDIWLTITRWHSSTRISLTVKHNAQRTSIVHSSDMRPGIERYCASRYNSAVIYCGSTAENNSHLLVDVEFVLSADFSIVFAHNRHIRRGGFDPDLDGEWVLPPEREGLGAG